MKMKEFAASLGVTLTLNFSHKMSEMEYLSKFVEYPTKETTREWQALRSFRIEQLLRHDTPQTRVKLDKVLKEKMPPMFIRQDTHALWLRETGYRYYQSSLNRYLWADVQRYAGQGTLLALDHGSYQRSATKWCDTVNRLCDLHDVRQRYVLRFDKYGMSEVHQTNPRWKEQALSGRQQYLLKFLKDNKILPYMKVLQIHFTVKENDPSKYERFITKLNKNWKSRDQLLRELVDGLYGITNSIPDAWSKKFQPNVDMTYVDIPLFSKNQYNEWYVISCLLKEFTEEEITFSMFASRIQESPYGSISDPYLFWERWNDLPTRQEWLKHDHKLFQAMVCWVTIVYMTTSFLELWVIKLFIIGPAYQFFLWTFVGLTKVYGLLNTIQWHSTGKSSREISRIMPRDPYQWSKRFCLFVVDFMPLEMGYILYPLCMILDCIPEILELCGTIWYKGTAVKEVGALNMPDNNPWSKHVDEYITEVRKANPPRLTVSETTGSGKSTALPAAIAGRAGPLGVNKQWLVMPVRILRDEWKPAFNMKYQVLKNKRKLIQMLIYIY